LAASHGASSIDAVCTSAARDASNGAEFLALATRALGRAPRIIDGQEEARLTFNGAITGLELRGEAIVFDVGGGSTEIIHGDVDGSDGHVRAATSLDVGSVRLTERHVRSDPPRDEELRALRADIDRALSVVERRPGLELVGVAGTVTTLSAIHHGLPVYDPARVHGSKLTRAVVSEIAARLAKLPLDARRRVTGLEPGRADVIVAGAELVIALLEWAGVESLRVSDRGVRWGLARAALRSGSIART
jgi:exopolyphosphatase/guanosine-5'-triphosphate,3'-diphosphate pyrophosphatase